MQKMWKKHNNKKVEGFMKKNFSIIFLFLFILLTFCTVSNSNKIVKTPEDAEKAKVVEIGDIVEIDYIAMLEDGSIVDTSLKSVAEDEMRKKSKFFKIRSDYKPLVFRAGNSSIIKGLEENIIDMREGEEKEFIINASEAYGEWKKELTKSYPKEQEYDVFEAVSFDALPISEDEIEVNKTFRWHYWLGKIIDIDNSTRTVVVENLAKNTTINLEFGKMFVEAGGDKIKVRLEPTLGAEIETKFGKARVYKSNETDFVLDFNHPLAGKNLKFWVRVNKIKKGDENEK